MNVSLFYYSDSFSCPLSQGVMHAKIFTEPKETEEILQFYTANSNRPVKWN